MTILSYKKMSESNYLEYDQILVKYDRTPVKNSFQEAKGKQE
jgi:hypothetical protein